MKNMKLAALLLLLPAALMAQDTLAVGRPAPTFFLPALDGSKFFLSEHLAPQGKKTVVLDFFTTWCGPCKKELPLLDALIKKYPKDSVLLVLIDVGEKKDTVLANFNPAYFYPVLLDQFNAIGEKYGVKSFPSLFIIDNNGILRYAGVGFDEKTGLADAKKILDQLVLKKKIKGKKAKRV
jgi:thiol-disulfide isomerase/thioredoxin